MNDRFHYTKLVLIILGIILIFAIDLTKAEDSESAPTWNCDRLLDPQTNQT